MSFFKLMIIQNKRPEFFCIESWTDDYLLAGNFWIEISSNLLVSCRKAEIRKKPKSATEKTYLDKEMLIFFKHYLRQSPAQFSINSFLLGKDIPKTYHIWANVKKRQRSVFTPPPPYWRNQRKILPFHFQLKNFGWKLKISSCKSQCSHNFTETLWQVSNLSFTNSWFRFQHFSITIFAKETWK